MMQKISNPRGTADILPEDIPAWERLETIAKEILSIYGYRLIRTPLFEDISLFKRSLGETTEVVHKQLLQVQSQRVDSKEEASLALRPEGTAPIVRAYNQYDLGRKDYLSKLFYIGPMFRGERPQKGRLRMFHQIGAEAIGRGANHPLLDVEMISLAVKLIKSFGINNFKLKINSLGSVEDKKNFASWLRESLKDKIASLSDEIKAQYERNVFRLLDTKDPACQQVIASLNLTTQHLSDEGRHYFEQVKKGLDDLGVSYEVSSHLVRGLDYYTHTVFEFCYDKLGSQDAIGAGGRYNGLIEQLGGGDRRNPQNIGAIGFALGMERLLLALEAEGQEIPEQSSVDVFVVASNASYENKAFSIVHQLRQKNISADMDFGQRSLKKQFEQADKVKAQYVWILAEEEFSTNTISIKDMKTGKQERIDLVQALMKASKN